jgi:hypothetical protein
MTDNGQNNLVSKDLKTPQDINLWERFRRYLLNDSYFSSLIKKWKAFIVILFDPWVFLLIGATIFILAQLSGQDNSNITSYLNLVLAITTGILGGIVAKKFDDIISESKLKTRGKSAIRNLRYLLNRIGSLEKRVRYFSEAHIEPREATTEGLTEFFNSVQEECIGQGQIVINSISDWEEIVPEANIQVQLDIIKAYEEKITTYITHERNKEKKSKAEVKKLKSEIASISNEYYQYVGRNGLSGISGSSIGGTISPSGPTGASGPIAPSGFWSPRSPSSPSSTYISGSAVDLSGPSDSNYKVE